MRFLEALLLLANLLTFLALAVPGSPPRSSRGVARERSGKEMVEVRPMCYVTLTIDHRVLDGYQANAFLARWVEEIEGWP